MTIAAGQTPAFNELVPGARFDPSFKTLSIDIDQIPGLSANECYDDRGNGFEVLMRLLETGRASFLAIPEADRPVNYSFGAKTQQFTNVENVYQEGLSLTATKVQEPAAVSVQREAADPYLLDDSAIPADAAAVSGRDARGT